MLRDYWKWFSPVLGREMEMLVYGHGGTPMLVFPTRMGRFYEYEDGGMIGVLRPHLENGWLQLYCVDSIDNESLYCDWRHPRDRILRHVAYESYILDDVLPFIHWRNPCDFLMVHGCSLGAFHAVNIAFRHPDRFNKVVAFSGRYDLCQASPGFSDLFGGYYDDTIYYNTPCHFLPKLTDPELLSRMRRLETLLVIGEDDPFLPNNLDFSEVLWSKGIWHSRHLWPGRAHNFHAWRQMAARFL